MLFLSFSEEHSFAESLPQMVVGTGEANESGLREFPVRDLVAHLVWLLGYHSGPDLQS